MENNTEIQNTNEPSQKEKYHFGIDHLVLKIIAIICMTLDHVGLLLLDYNSVGQIVLRNIGRLALPLFMFLIVDSMVRTKKKEALLLRLGICAVINIIACYIITAIYESYVGAIFVDLFLMATITYFVMKRNVYSLIAIVPLAIYIISGFQFSVDNIPVFPFITDGGFYSLLIGLSAVAGYFFAPIIAKKYALSRQVDTKFFTQTYSLTITKIVTIVLVLTFSIINLLIYHYTSHYIFLNELQDGVFRDYGLIAFIFVAFYNGKRGYSNTIIKYSFYAYYPLHIAIIFLFSLLK